MKNSILSKIRWPRPFAGLRGITLADVPREASAGVTLAALMIPLNIGYAQVAGLPPAAGLYAAIIPLVVFAHGYDIAAADYADLLRDLAAQRLEDLRLVARRRPCRPAPAPGPSPLRACRSMMMKTNRTTIAPA